MEGFIACEARAVNVLQAQADASPLVQAYCAALHMFAEFGRTTATPGPSSNKPSPTHTRPANASSALWLLWPLGLMRPAPAIALHEEQARLHPRDLASIKLGQYHLFNRGDSPACCGWPCKPSQPPPMCPTCTACWPLAGSNATGSKKQKPPPAAPSAVCRKEPWAHHALAHVMLTQGRISEGIDFMSSVSDTLVRV